MTSRVSFKSAGAKRITKQAFVPRVVMSQEEKPFSIEMPKGSFWEKYAAMMDRIEHGLQCPECSGVRISARQTRFDPSPTGWQCEECGCQWSSRI